MRVVEPSVELLNIDDLFRKIEVVGRTCYKSSSNMTDETARRFYKGLVDRKHVAMLEHVTFVFEVTENYYGDLRGYPFFTYSIEELKNGRERFLISANLRAINESGEMFLLSKLWDIDPDLVYRKDLLTRPMEVYPRIADEYIQVVDIESISDIQEHAYKAHKYHTFHFICDRGVSHEIVRHRPASYAQESTRYCNYANDKFGNEITVIKPSFWKENSVHYYNWKRCCEDSEQCYLYLLRQGATPQEARSVLPNSLKTEIIMTANCKEFDHFFNLRSLGTTGSPHPQMKQVADLALSLYTCNSRAF